MAASGCPPRSSVVPVGGDPPRASLGTTTSPGKGSPLPSDGGIIDPPAEVSLEVDDLERLISNKLEGAKKKRAERSNAGSASIMEVPSAMKGTQKEAYEPKLVSIGPLHHVNPTLGPMEEIKMNYLSSLLDRSLGRNKLSNYLRVIRGCLTTARGRYDKVEMEEGDFVNMLVVDGCFIIEYFLRLHYGERLELPGGSWACSQLRTDLMLLENQIPFFVLTELFKQTEFPPKVSNPVKPPEDVMDLAIGFLKINVPEGKRPKPDDVLHLLHLHHRCMDPVLFPEEKWSCSRLLCYPCKLPFRLISSVFFALLYLVLKCKWPSCQCCFRPDPTTKQMTIPSATELRRGGVRIKAKKGGRRRPSFDDGKLEIPRLRVQESTKWELRNLIALEQCCSNSDIKKHFTNYAAFMDNIIDTAGDVALLKSKGIIESKLGSDEEVARLFNSLCKGTHLPYDDQHNEKLFEEVNAYVQAPHHRWIASFKETYFGNPWALISLLAAALLFFLTSVEAYYSAFPRN